VLHQRQSRVCPYEASRWRRRVAAAKQFRWNVEGWFLSRRSTTAWWVNFLWASLVILRKFLLTRGRIIW
jgi:hypothetical protein